MTKPRGFGYIEIVIVLAVVAVAGYLLMQYFTTTAKTVEKLQQDRPLARTRRIAIRGERNPTTIWRPHRHQVEVRVKREPAGHASFDVQQPDVSGPLSRA